MGHARPVLPAGSVVSAASAAKVWLNLATTGDVGAAWGACEHDLRVALARALVWSQRKHWPAGFDRDAVVKGLASQGSSRPFLAAVRELWCSWWPPNELATVVAARRTTPLLPDVEVVHLVTLHGVRVVPFGGEHSGLAMRLYAPSWHVCGVTGDRLPRVGWPDDDDP